MQEKNSISNFNVFFSLSLHNHLPITAMEAWGTGGRLLEPPPISAHTAAMGAWGTGGRLLEPPPILLIMAAFKAWEGRP